MTCKRIPARYLFACLAFVATFNLYSLRLNLSVAIVDMVDQRQEVKNGTETNETLSNTSIPRAAIPMDKSNSSVVIEENDDDVDAEEKFSWNKSQQGFLLSAYFYGYLFTQVPGAYLGRKFGRVRVLGICVLASSTLTILFPVVANGIGFYVTVATRVLIGLMSGVTMPIVYALISSWAPEGERSKFISVIFAGVPAGTCIVLPLSGVLVDALGWESIFYVTGSVGLLWSVLWFSFIYESPEKHPKLSNSEKRLYGFENRKETVIETDETSQRPVPFLSILRSKAWICLAFTHFSNLFGRYLLMTMLPSYLNAMLNIDVKSAGILSSVPFILGTLVLFGSGHLADFLIAKGFKSIYVRKALTTIGLLTTCVVLSIVAYIGSNVAVAMTLFSIAVAMDSLIVPGFKACIMEITPEFSGIAYGMSNTVSTLSGVLAPQITGVLRQKFVEEPLTGWRASFWIGGGVSFLGAMVFLIFGTNRKQPWSYKKKEEVKDDEQSTLKV